MARHYSTKDFFRQMPNALLARYFHERGLFEHLDFSVMKEGKSDALFAAWLCLSEEQRNAMDAEFGNIFEMSCEKGFRAIIDEARWQMQTDPEALTEFVETLSAMPNHYHRAMSTYLDHSKCWKGATRFYHADTLPYWRKRKNMGHRPAVVDDAKMNSLKERSRYFWLFFLIFHIITPRLIAQFLRPAHFRLGKLSGTAHSTVIPARAGAVE